MLYMLFVVIGISIATSLIAWGMCEAAAESDREKQREREARQLEMSMRAFQWPER